MAEAKNKGNASKRATGIRKAPAAKKPAATAKPVVKAVASTKKFAPAKNTAQSKKAGLSSKWSPGPQERYNMVQVAAYYIAERNGFNGNPLEFWTAAEVQVSKMLTGK